MKYFYLGFLIALLMHCKEVRSSENSLITTEIRYSSSEASEVFLVWGINDWKLQDKNLLPAGTYVKKDLLHTPMEQTEGVFSVQLKVKPHTKIDYVFWLTKGVRNTNTDIWDLNKAPEKDYHTLALQNSIVLIESDLPARPKDALSLLHFAWPLLLIMATLFLSIILVRKYVMKLTAKNPGVIPIILASAGVLFLALILIRSSVMQISWDLYQHPLEFMPSLLWAGFYDLLYVGILTVTALFFLFLFRKYPRVRLGIGYSFIAIGLFSLATALLNIRIVDMLGKPFNYRWLYYSDFLNSADAKSALLANISSSYILEIIAICISVILAGLLLLFIIESLSQNTKVRNFSLTAGVCVHLAYMVFAWRAVQERKWNYDQLANPIVAFAGSLPFFTHGSHLFTMEVPDSLRISAHRKKNNLFSFTKEKSKIKNVILFVLESTPAEYVQPYDQKFRVTPQLEKYLSTSLVFDNVYAHAPATNKSMVSLLGSVYPWLSYTSITEEHPDVKMPTLSSELKAYGYRTAFFNSGDNNFQQAGKFLEHRKFDVIRDCKSLNCDREFHPEDEEWEDLDGMDDECTARELMSWVKQDTASPFFAMMWTYQTHYPYYFSGAEKTYSEDPILNRYLNAVNHSDEVLGKLIEELKNDGLFESTLVVVVGDHGEAFGRHEQTTHASGIYEENLHVPCIFINPLFKGSMHSDPGGLVDIAPTVMNMLGLQEAGNWQGQDLLTTVKNKRVYFFSPWSDYLFGYREGDRKYIFNATKNTTEIYDLKADPYETKNLAEELPTEIEHCHRCLAAWTQHTNSFMNDLLDPGIKKK